MFQFYSNPSWAHQELPAVEETKPVEQSVPMQEVIQEELVEEKEEPMKVDVVEPKTPQVVMEAEYRVEKIKQPAEIPSAVLEELPEVKEMTRFEEEELPEIEYK